MNGANPDLLKMGSSGEKLSKINKKEESKANGEEID